MEFESNKPIYLQLVEKIKAQIISGRFQPGEKLPAVRELAAEFKVNPNTMKRAFACLESEGLVYTERTSGRFVSSDTAIMETIKAEQATKVCQSFVQEMRSLSFTDEQIQAMVGECLTKQKEDKQ